MDEEVRVAQLIPACGAQARSQMIMSSLAARLRGSYGKLKDLG